jgi:uncharacterized repeat protein (TIGR01451 family)
MKNSALLLAFLAVIILIPSTVFAFESEPPPIVKKAQFESVKDGVWSDQNTWDPIGVPDTGDTATVKHTVTINGNVKCGNVTVNATKTLTIMGPASLTIDSGSQIVNNGTFVVNGAGGLAELTSNGLASFTIAGASWNGTCGFTNFSYPFTLNTTPATFQVGKFGNLTIGAFTVGSNVNLSGYLISTGQINVISTLNMGGNSLTAGAGISTSSGSWITGGGTINCNGGMFNISGRVDLSPGSILNMPGGASANGQYGISVYGTGCVSATGSAGNFVYINKSGTYYPYIYLQDASNCLFDYCSITGFGSSSATTTSGIYAASVDGNASLSMGAGNEGLTIKNCTIRDGNYGGIWLATCTGNIISANTIYNCPEWGIKVGNSQAGSNNHQIGNNTIYNSTSGTNGYGIGLYTTAADNCFSSFPISNTTIYNCRYGITATGVSGTGANTVEQIFRDCSLGTLGQNSVADVGFGVSVTNCGLRLENCVLASPTEVEATNIDSNDDRIVSYRHDNVPGLVRVWGDWRPTDAGQLILIRYDTALVAGVTNDANIQKIVEFGPCAAAMAPVGGTTYGTRGVSRFRTGTLQNGAGIEFVGITTPNWAPVLVRSVGDNTYSILIEGSGLKACKFSAYAAEFQNISGTLISSTGYLAPTSVGGYLSLDYCTFKNTFAGATRHIALQEGGNVITRSYTTFDTSATYDVRVDNNTNITFTNFINSRANTADENEPTGGTVAWSNPGKTYYAVATFTWDNPLTWSLSPGGPSNVGPPTINDNVVITAYTVTISTAPGTVSCTNLTVSDAGVLRFNPTVAARSLIIKNGGIISNTGTINFQSNVNPVTITAQTLTNPSMVIYKGNDLTWLAGLNLVLAGIDYQRAMNPSAAVGITFSGNMQTQTVTVTNDSNLTLDGGGTSISWTALGDIYVGTAATAGTLQLKPETGLKILCGSNGQYGLIVDSLGTLTATGTAAGDRDCRITSASSFRSYIYCMAGSLSKFQNCEIYELGYNQGSPYTKDGLFVENVNNAVAGQGLTIDSCNLHHSYAGFMSNAITNASITNCNVYNNSWVGVYLWASSFAGNTFNTVTNSEFYNNGWGLLVGYSNKNTFTNNTVHNNYSGGLYENCCGDNTWTGGSSYGNTMYGVTIINTQYNGVYTPSTFTNIQFGNPTANSIGDVRLSTTASDITYAVFQNCLFNSTNEVVWLNPTAVKAGSYLISYRHDQVAGAIRIFGDYVRSAGTEDWNFTDPYTGTALDANTAKTITFMAGPSGLNGGTSRFRLETGATLDMASGNTTPVNITSVKASAGLYYNMILTGTVNANCYKFENVGYDAANSNYGLEIRSPAANITLTNGTYANYKSDSQFLYFNNTATFGDNLTISGCSFDNSAWYDVWTNIGAAQYITFTNYSNDYPNTKDYEQQGYADWLVTGAWTTAKDGNWWEPQTWNNASVPPDWTDVTINHAVNVTGTVKTGNITINSGGLGLNGAAQNTTLQVLAGMTITNNASISVTNDTNTVKLTSSGVGFPDYFIFTGNPINLNSKSMTIGLCQSQSVITVPNLSVLTIDNDLRTITTTIQAGGELKHQTSGKEWSASGNISVSGILRLGNNTLTRINCLSVDGQYGIEVNAGGYFEALGTSADARDCQISNGGPSTYKPYIYLKDLSGTLLRYVTVSYVGTSTATSKFGIYAQAVDGQNPAQGVEGLLIEACNIYNCYTGIVLDGCSGNRIARDGAGNASWVHDNYDGIRIMGGTNLTTIEKTYVYSQTNIALILDGGTITQTLSDMWISKNKYGLGLYQSGTDVPRDMVINSVITSSTTADIYCQPGTAHELILRNTALSSTNEIDPAALPSVVGAWIISQMHDQIPGRTVIWGDFSSSALGNPLKFNYADASYPGAGDANTRKSLLFGPCSIVARDNESLINIDSNSVLQLKGGMGLAQATQVTTYTGATRFRSIEVYGTIDANNVIISGHDSAGVRVNASGTIADFANITFTNSGTGGARHLHIVNGQSKTIDGCSFDDSNTVGKDIDVSDNGVNPTIITFTNYTNTAPGSKDAESGSSRAIWKSTIALFNPETIMPGTIYQGDANVGMLKFNVAPSLPAGAVCSETLLTYVAVTLTGGGAFSDSDISAVKIYRDTDASNSFDPTKDTLISTPVSFTGWYVNIPLVPAQDVLTGTNMFFVAYDISRTAGPVTIGARLVDNNYFTVSAPHDKAVLSQFTAGPVGITPVDWKSDLQLRKDPADGWTGNDIYTLDGQNENIISNTVNTLVASYYIRIENDGGLLGNFSVTGDAGSAGWFVTYYSAISGDITSGITGPGILLNLANAATWDFTVGLEPQGQVTGASKALKIWSRPKDEAATTLQDLVKCTTYIYSNRSDLAVKAQGGSYSTDDTFDPPTEQKLSATINKNTMVTYYVRIQNDGTANDQITVTGTSAASLGTGWTVRYYDSGNTDITTNMTNGLGWLSPVLTSTGTTEIRVEATATDTAVAGTYTIIVYGQCNGAPSRQDQVKIALTVNSVYKADAMVKKGTEDDSQYLTDNIDETIPAAQVKNTSISVGGIASYYIKLQNDGNVTDNFTITGTNASQGVTGGTWWVTYYYGTVDITSDVIANKWLSPPVAVGSNIVLTAYIYNQIGATGNVKDDYLTVISYNNSAQKDAVKMITSCGQLQQPDAMVSNNAGQDGNTNETYDTTLTPTATSQVITQTVPSYVVVPGSEVTYYITLQNDAINNDTFSITAASPTGAGTGSGWLITYYTYSTMTDITANVLNYAGGGYGTPSIIANGGAITITAVVSYNSALVGTNVTKEIYIYVNSGANASKRDVVKCVAKTANYQPDLYSSASTGGTWVTDNTYSATPETQMQTKVFDNGQTVTYYYRIQNDGTYATGGASYSITGTDGDVGSWTITYYYDGAVVANDMPDPWEEIDITNGWLPGNFNVGETKQLIVLITAKSAARGATANFDIYATRIETGETDTARIRAQAPSPDLWINKDNGAVWTGKDSYAPTAQITSTLTAGSTVVTYYFTLENETSLADTFSMTASGTSGAGWFITYYDQSAAPGNDITAQITTPNTGWLAGNVNAASTKGIRAEVEYNAYVASVNQTKSITIYAFSTCLPAGTPGFYDAVAGQVTSASYKPDMLAKKASDAYSFDNIWNSDSTVQNLSATVSNNQTVTYYYKLENEGTYTATSYSITGHSGNIGNWWITYYTDPDGDGGQIDENPISITMPGYATVSLTPTGVAYLRVNIYVTALEAPGQSRVFKIYATKTDTNEADSAQITAQVPGTDALITFNYDPDVTSSTWKTNNVYETAIPNSTQIVSRTTEANTAVSYYIMIQNDGGALDTISITGISSAQLGAGWWITYYDSFDSVNDITGQVIGGGYPIINLGATLTATMRCEVCYDNAAYIGQTKDVYIVVNSTTIAGSSDVINAQIVTANYKPDLLSKPAGGGYTGSDGYSSDSANLNQATNINNYQLLTYYYQIQNDGNYNSPGYTITGGGNAAKWWITYYDDGALLENISDDTPVTGTNGAGLVTGAGYYTGAITQGQSKYLRVNVYVENDSAAASQTFRIWATKTDTGETDAGQIVATVTNSYTVDAMYQKATGGSYANTDNVYETPAPTGDATQNQIVTRAYPSAGNPVTYFVRLENEGNTDTTYTVTGAVTTYSLTGSWTISCYNSTTVFNGSTDITTDIAGAGWVSPAIDRSPTYGGVTNYKDITVVFIPSIDLTGAFSCTTVARARSNLGTAPADSVIVTTLMSTEYKPDAEINNGGGYTGNNVWNTDGSGANNQTKTTDRNVAATYKVQLGNDGNINETFTMTGTSSAQLGTGWTVSYYSDAGYLTEVTNDVVITGYATVAVGLGATSEVLWIKVTPDNTVAGNSTVTATVTAISSNDNSKKDAVSMATTVNNAYQVDAQINQSGWTGDNQYYPPTDQIASAGFNNKQTLTYYIKIQNEGNTNETIKLTGEGTPAGDKWIVSYYDNSGAGRTDISQNVITTLNYTVALTRYNQAGYQTTDTQIWAEITALTYTAGAETFDTSVWAIVQGGTGNEKSDKVIARATVNNIYQADSMVKLGTEDDGSYYYDGDYAWDLTGSPYYETMPPTNQAKSANTDNVTPASYYIKIQNDGNTTENITVTGTGTWTAGTYGALGGWGTVTYYDDTPAVPSLAGGGADVTNSVLNGTYTKSLLRFAGESTPDYRLIRVLVHPYNTAASDSTYDVYAIANSTAGGATKLDAIKTLSQVKSNYRPDLIVKRGGYGDPDYLRDGPLYYPDAVGDQVKSQTLTNRPSAATVTYYVKVQQDGILNDDTISIVGNASAGGWWVSYYEIANEAEIPGSAITNEVTVDGKAYALTSGTSQLVRIIVTADINVAGGNVFTATLTATSNKQPAKQDRILAVTTNNTYYMTDAWISATDSSSYTGDGVNDYTPPPALAAHKKALSVFDFAPTTYYIKVENDGNVADTITVQGNTGNADWVVSYYEDTNGIYNAADPDITALVIGTGWAQSITAKNTKQVRMWITPQPTALSGTIYTSVVSLASTGNPAAGAKDHVQGTTTVYVTSYRSDIMVKQADTSYASTSAYETTPSSQVRSQFVGRGQYITYYLKIQNDGNAGDTLSLTGTGADGQGWFISYYEDNGVLETYENGVDIDISSSVSGSGYSWALANAETKNIIIRMLPLWGVASSTSKTVYVGVTSWANAGQDICQITSTAQAGYQPDNSIRTSAEVSFTGDGQYAVPYYGVGNSGWFGIEQLKSQTITETGRTVTYYVTVQNDSNTNDSLTVTGTAGDGTDWFVTYYNETGGANITANVINGTWTAGPLAQNEADSRIIRVEMTARTGLAGTSSKTLDIKTYSVQDGTKYDTVRAQATVQSFSKPNTLVKEDADGAYLGSGDYNATAINQTRGPISVANSAVVTYYTQIANDGNIVEGYSVTAVKTAGWFVTFYQAPDGDDNDSSDDTIINYASSTFTWSTGNLAIGGVKYLRINAEPSNQYGSVPQYLYITASSTSSAKDVVMCSSVVSHSNKPDALLTKEGYGDTSVKGTYQYNDAYYPPTGQITSTAIANNQALTYYIWIENDGNTNETYLITGSSPSSGWWVTYYEDASGVTDISANVKAGTYQAVTTGVIMEPYSITGLKRVIRMVVTADNTLNGTNAATFVVKATDSSLATDTVGVTFTVNTTYQVNASIGSVTGGPYTGESVYTPSTALDPNQAVSRTANTNKIVTYYVKVVNEANVTDTITLAVAGSGAGWWITYYDPASANITANMISSGWATSFTRNQSKEIRIEITPDGSVIGTAMLPVTVTATASGGVVDSVLAKTTAQRPDVLIKGNGYGDASVKGTYTYNDIYSPTSQITSTVITNNQVLTYYIWIENDGNANETAYAVTGTSSYGGWIVSYYDGASGEDDSITATVGLGTYNPGNAGTMEPYSVTGWKRVIRMRVTATNNLAGSAAGSFIARVSDASGNTDTVGVNTTVVTDYKVNTSVKTESGSYTGDVKYTPPDALDPDQTVTNTVASGSVLTYYAKVVNEGNVTDTLSVTGTGSSAGWWVSYYTVPGGADITANITNPAVGWSTSFIRNEIKEVKILVQADTNGPDGGNSKAISITAWSTLSTTKYDSGLIKTTVVTTRKPDLLISLDNVVFSGDGDYEDEIAPISANQTKTGSGENNEVITYYVKLQNEGNLGETYTVSMTLPGSGWVITFYDNTDTIRSLPWVSGTITKTDSITVKILVMPVGKNNGDSGDLIIYAKSTDDITKVDAVDAKTTVSAANILYPQDYKQVGTTPVFMGQAAPGVTVELWDITGGLPGTQVVTSTADVNGYWRMKVTGALSVGGHTFKTIAGGVEGQPRPITVEAVAPATVPVINSPGENDYIKDTNKPLITGNAGVANAGQVITATVNINTTATELYDMNIGTATVLGDGSYTINLTRPLPRGTRQIALICNGVLSDLRTVILVDPIGVLYDDVTNQPIDGMEVSLWRSTTDGAFTWTLCPVGGLAGEIGGPVGVTNPQTSGWTGVAGQYQFLLGQPAVGTAYNYKIVVTNSSGYSFPSSVASYQAITSTIIGSAGTASIPAFIDLFPGDPVTRTIYVDDTTYLGVAPSVARNLSIGGYFEMDNSELDLIYADIPLSPAATLLRITKASNKPEVSIGDILTYEIKIINSNASPVKNVYIRDIMPAGFKYIDGSTMIDNTTKLADPTGGRTRIFNVGTVAAQSTKIIRYQLVVGTAVTFGEYKNTAQAEYAGGVVISNKSQVKVRVIPDPVFDYATIIGKVFNDYDGNGVQGENEPGIDRVKIITEDGIMVETDQYGKYHIAGLKPKTKLLKVVESSLPIGAEFTTPNPVMVRFTLGGHLEKVNFGLKLAQSADSMERRIVKVNIKVVTTPEGNPQVSVAGAPVRMMFPPKREGATEKRVRVQIGYSMLALDENGNYNGEYVLLPGETTLKIWAENRWGYEKEERHAVSLPSLEVKIYREDDRPALTPELGLVVAPEILNIKAGRLAEAARFKIITNYGQFINKWKLVIYEPVRGGAWLPQEKPDGLMASAESTERTDALIAEEFAEAEGKAPAGYQVFYERTGTGKDIDKDIIWEGRSTDRGKMVDMDKAYKYKLFVEGRDGNVDMTREGQLIVVSFWAEKLRKVFGIDVPLVGGAKLTPAIGPIQTASGTNINTSGKVYSISGKTDPKNKIVISTPGSKVAGVEVEPFEDGSFETEVYVSATEGRMLIEAITPDKQRRVQRSENIKAPEKREEGYLVLNGLIDTQFGSNNASGALDATRNDKTMRDGSYGTGRAALFLKARLGEYQLTSSFDSQREDKELFKFIDPDKFYPLYGDSSVRTDVADNTQGMFYVKVEREQSSAMWGNYSTGFSGTELAQYNRGFYGAKIQLAKPFFSTTNATLFVAEAKQLASHNEIRATGGSLYYLKDRYLMEGSEKIAIEVRDKVNGMTISSSVMSAGADYEIDYKNGRIIFYQPIASVASSNTIISTELLDGNHVYIVVDYEYDASRHSTKNASGLRITQPVGKSIDLGLTYVTEEKPLSDYSLMGTDFKVRLPRSLGNIGFEYASSESESIPGFISYDGGFDFATLPTSQSADGAAYKLNLNFDLGLAFTKVANEVMFAGYFQNIEKGFSSGQSIFQQGTTKFGFTTTAKLTQRDNLLIRFDGQQLDASGGNTASATQVGADSSQSLNIQVTHDQAPLRLTGSYQYQATGKPIYNSLMRDEGSQILAVRADYQVNKEWTLSVEQQGVLAGKPNNQTTLGGALKLTEKERLDLSTTMGTLGNAVQAGITSQVSDKHALYTKYQVSEDKAGNKAYSTIFGERKQVSKDVGIYREERFSGRNTAEDTQYSGLMGLDYILNQYWSMGANYERSQVDNIHGTLTSRDVASIGLSYNSHPREKDPSQVKGYMRFNTRLEYRLDKGAPDRNSILTANKLYYQFNGDASSIVKMNYSKTNNDTTGEVEAEFTEVSVGMAYRPINNDKYNLLTKITYQTDRTPRNLEPMVSNLESAMILSLEGAVDLNPKMQALGKLAYKQATEETGNHGSLTSSTYLIAPRFNYKIESASKIINNWIVGVEYRMLVAQLAEDQKSGFVLEFEKELTRYNSPVGPMGVNLGFGYNFTDFTDDLSVYDDDYSVKGFFIRLSTKF